MQLGHGATYAISNEQGARKKALDNRQRTAVNRPVWIRKTLLFYWSDWLSPQLLTRSRPK
jgi:hypothetical protein